MGGTKTGIWTSDGAQLRSRVAVADSREAEFLSYARHRLRMARALRFGFVHPVDIGFDSDILTLQLPLSVGHASAPLDDRRWKHEVLLPLVQTLVRCHDQRIAGLAALGVVEGRWIPPVAWFTGASQTGEFESSRRQDLTTAAAWLEGELAARRLHPRDQSLARTLLEALRDGEPQRLRRLIEEDCRQTELGARTMPPPPTFLTLLTEAELLERVASVYRYRLMRAHDCEALGLGGPGELVLEVDRSWEDPHFRKLKRPSPQEIWDAQVDESRVTPVLAVSRRVPNPLQKKLKLDEQVVRWIGTHVDQPFMFVRPDGQRIPPQGWVRLQLAGDNALMARKRAFTAFAERHPSLTPLLNQPPPAVAFQDNPQARDDLEGAVLGARGVFAVQGPPGTGKTHLATHVVRRFLAWTPGGRVLICAKEHFALDHILRKITQALEDDGVEFRAWRSVSLAKRRRGKGEVDETWQAPAVVRDLGSRQWEPDYAGWARWQASTSDIHDQRLSTLGQSSANLFFATTMDSAMVDFLDTESFDLVIVEEAGKCYPSELLHALCLGRTALMIGDQRQLPPYQERRTREGVESWRATLARSAKDKRFRDELVARLGSLFLSLEAMAEQRGPPTPEEQAWLRPFEFLFDRLPARHRLEEQFRMEAPLSRVVGGVFYGRPFIHRKHELVEAGLLPPRPLGDVLPPELDVPLLWLDVPHMTVVPDATEDPRKRGVRDNQYELDVVIGYLKQLRPRQPVDMVILTPYNAQKRLMLDSSELRAVCASLTDTPFEQVVRTTDEYQGREAELTVLSLVRNNSLGARAWGFMTEPERLNVMFSRTRFRQVVVASSAHIERHAAECEWLHKVWRAYQAEARDQRDALILPAAEVTRG